MKKLLVLLVIMFAAFACEKEPIDPCPNFNNIIGEWTLMHVVDGESVPEIEINGIQYRYELTIHNLMEGEVDEYRNNLFHRTYKFYLTPAEDSMYFSYLYQQPIMAPESGWNNYLQWDDILLIGYQQWFRK